MAYLIFSLAIITAIKHAHLSRAFVATIAALALGIVAPASSADDDEPFDEAHLFFELNNTDGDLGIHALIDGDAWRKLEIEDRDGRRMLKIKVRGRLGLQGLTEIFFESAEPTFDELSPAKFFRRFPAGFYEIEGETLEGEELESEVQLTHVMPAPPIVKVNGRDAAADCDTPLENVIRPVMLSWDDVTMSHPDSEGGGAGVQPPIRVTIHNYEVVVEIDETPFRTSIILPPGVTEFVVPSEILALSDLNDGEVKFEVLAREVSFNQTAVESCFELE